MSPHKTHFGPIVCTALFIAACTTPVIPLPPPEANKITFRLDTVSIPSVATFQYAIHQALGGARVYVVNDTQGVGVIATANFDGSVDETPPFLANAGDRIVVRFEMMDGDRSALCVIMVDGTLNANDRCP